MHHLQAVAKKRTVNPDRVLQAFSGSAQRAETSFVSSFPRHAERTSNRCNCQPSWSETTIKGQTVGSGGGCSDDIPADDTPGWCYVIPETCTSPPQRRHGIPWDVCISAFSHSTVLLVPCTPMTHGSLNPDLRNGP